MRRVFSILMGPLFFLAGAAGFALLTAGPASAAPALPAACPTYGSGGCTGSGTASTGTSSNGTTTLSFNTQAVFTPGETVDGTVHSKPVSVGTFTANSQGVVSGTITLPGGIPAGNHVLVLTGTVSGATVSIPFSLATATSGSTPCTAAYSTHSSGIVLAAAYITTACVSAVPSAPNAPTPSALGAPAAPQSSSQLPFTGANVATGVTVAAMALVAGGLLVLSTRRRRRSAWEAK